MSKRLIVTADDFGLDVAVNEAVERAARHGILTCASLMITAAAAQDAVVRARSLPMLAVGLHLVLVDGVPALPAEQVSELLGPDGRFRASLLAQGVRIYCIPRARRQVEAEIRAQIARFRATGLTLDHVNAHQHFHLHPTVQRTLVLIASTEAIPGIRVPLELGGGASQRDRTARLTAWIERLQSRRLDARLRRALIARNDRVFGIAWSGHMNAARVRSIVDTLPDGTSEIYLHPVARPWRPGDPWPEDYEGVAEMKALLDPDLRAELERRGVELVSFATAGS